MDWTAVDWIPIAWVIGGVLIILTELVVTGIVAVFFGIGAIVTGLAIALGMPGTGWAPFVLCSVVSIGTLVALRDRFSPWMRQHRRGRRARCGRRLRRPGRRSALGLRRR